MSNPPSSLPIQNHKSRICTLWEENQVTILMGETACGKTTQVPQFILEKGDRVVCTQPRRIAAISSAKRVCLERSCECGVESEVGYSVRFDNCYGPKTRLIYMTDGMLVREAMKNPRLKSFGTIVLDEVHERTVQTDILLAVVKRAQKMRNGADGKRLKIILMSATMDVDAFTKYFFHKSPPPVLYIEGRGFRYTIYHLSEHDDSSNYIQLSLRTLDYLHKKLPRKEGVLVFLTGQDEIDSFVAILKRFYTMTLFDWLGKFLGFRSGLFD